MLGVLAVQETRPHRTHRKVRVNFGKEQRLAMDASADIQVDLCCDSEKLTT